MQTQEKQDYLHKIQNLIESGEKENIKLALQLIRGLELEEDIFKENAKMEEDLLYKLVFEFSSLDISIDKNNFCVEELEKTMRSYENKIKKRIFALYLELYEQTIEYKREKNLFKILLYKTQVIIIRQIIGITDNIIEDFLDAKEYIKIISNTKLQDFYRNSLIGGRLKLTHTDEDKKLSWATITRRSNYPIICKITPYHNEKAIFTVIVKVDVPQ